MAIKTILVDGVEHVVILERGSSDGGLVVNYLSPDDDGAHLNLRHWFQDPSLAEDAFVRVDDVTLREKRAQIIDMVKPVKVEPAEKVG